MDLNPEQQQAVNHILGPCTVTAVPGSGKTRTLTSRVVHLIKNCGVDPKNILCTTFTNKAANEMRERVSAEVGTLSDSIFINTFHGLCLAVLRKYGHLVGLRQPFSIYDEGNQIELLAKVARLEGMETTTPQLKVIARAANDFREETIKYEDALVGLDADEKRLIHRYMDILDELNAVDFSGILYKCWKVLQNPKIAEILSSRFKFVMVDEAQDMNDIQYQISKKIGSHGNLFFVGDYHQSIFSWRGARPDNLLQIHDDYPTVTEIVLPRNYRSTENILSVAQKLIRNNTNADDVVLISEKGKGYPVKFDTMVHDDAESDAVVTRIKHFKSEGRAWKDFAVLYRANHLSRVIEQKLRMADVPYRIMGGFSFFERREIKTALSYMQFLVNPFDTIAFARTMLEPKRGIGQVAIGKVESYCKEHKVSVLDACKTIDEIDGLLPRAREAMRSFTSILQKYRDKEQSGESMVIVANQLLEESGYVKYLEEMSQKDDKERQRIESLNELLSYMAEFKENMPNARMSDYIQSVMVNAPDEEDSDNAVSLLTMHAAKGLEFPVVFIIGCDEGIVPHARAVAERGLEEERRLMYVAVTRAQERLFISHRKVKRVLNKRTGSNIYVSVRPSQFLGELGYFSE